MLSREETVLVLGGRGFIGRRLTARLKEEGCRVRVAGRSGPAADAGTEYARADLADPSSLDEAVRGADVVFHLATGGGNQWADFERDFLIAGRSVAEACLRHGVRRLVYTSSTAALYLGGSAPLTEADGIDSQPRKRAFYSRAKIGAENLLMEMHRTSGLPVTILRPAIVVGAGGPLTHSGVGYWPSELWCLGWGRGGHPLPFVLVDDVAAAMAAARTVPGIEGRSFNLAGDVRISAREFVALLSERSLRHFHFYSQSLWKMQAVEIFKWLLKVAARKPENALPSYRDLKSRAMRAPLDCTAAKTILGWKPNADPVVFLSAAIDSNVDALLPGDPRGAAALPGVG